MARCPNINTIEWRALKNRYGLKNAIYLYDLNNQDIPTLDEAETLLKKAKENYPLVKEALLTDNQELADFMLTHLKETYPGIKMFNDKDSFNDFIKKNGVDPQKTSIDAIGQAFKDSVFIDPERAVQSTPLHEYSHIYWHALPSNNKTKKKIIDFYSDEHISLEDMEEAIIQDIANAGVSLSEVQLYGNKSTKFQELLREFWQEVKRFLGLASQQDLVEITARNLWNNKANFSQKDFTNHIVKNMLNNPNRITFNDKDYRMKYGDVELMSVSRVINMLSPFNQPYVLEKAAEKLIREKRENDDDGFSEQEIDFNTKQDIKEHLMQKWEWQAEAGDALHLIPHSIINKGSINDLSEKIVNHKKGTKVKDYFSQEILEKSRKAINTFIKNKEKDGWTLNSEVLMGSIKSKVGGIADVVMEKNGKFVVIDFKSMFQEDRSDYQYGNFLKAPLETILDTKENKHKIQVNIYGNILEEQENKDVVETMIVPFVYQADGTNITDFEIGDIKSYKRKGRKSSVKDRNRTNAQKAMDYAATIQKVRDTELLTGEDIIKLAEKKNLDIDFLKEQNEAVSILTSLTGESLDKVSLETVQNILNVGVPEMIDTLIDTLGYDQNDLFGKDKIHIKQLFHSFNNSIKKEDYIEEDLTKDAFEKRYLKTHGLQPKDFGSDNVNDAFVVYKKQIDKLNNILEEVQDMDGLQNITIYNIDKYYSKVINDSAPESVNLKRFLEGIKVARLMTTRVRNENKKGFPFVKQATIYLYRLKRHEDNQYRVFKDFRHSSIIDSIFKTNFFKNKNLMDKEQVLIQILSAEMRGKHRAVIKHTNRIRLTLQHLYQDKFNEDRTKKPRSERKPLTNEDFEDIIHIDKKTGKKYYMTPSEAREVMEKKYGQDDIRVRNMTGYIYYLTEELKLYDQRIQNIVRNQRVQPRILVPEIQSRWWETLDNLNNLNKRHINDVQLVFGPGQYDNIILENPDNSTEKVKRVIDFKHDLYQEMEQLNAEGKDIGFVITKMKDVLKRAQNKMADIERPSNKILSVRGGQTGKVVNKTKHHNVAIQEHVTSIIDATYMKDIVPLLEYTKEKYQNVDRVFKFLEVEGDKNVYKTFADYNKKSMAGKRFKDISNLLIFQAATRFLAFSPNVVNRQMGVFYNFLAHPKTMYESYKMSLKNARSIFGIYRKTSGMMDYYNIGTIMKDVKFTRYQDLMDRLNTIAFKPLEWTEKWNQGELLKGLLTPEEMAAHNKNGKPFMVYNKDGKEEILDPDTLLSEMTKAERIKFERKIKSAKPHPNSLSDDRVNELENITSEVHGYFGFNKSQFSYYTLGQGLGLFVFSWGQAAANWIYLPKQTDSVGRVRKGILNSGMFMVNRFIYNYIYTNSKKDKYLERLENRYMSGDVYKTRKEAENALYDFNKFADPKKDGYIIEKTILGEKRYIIPGMNITLSDFEQFVYEREGSGKIKVSEVSKQDLNSSIRFLIGLAIPTLWWLMSFLLEEWKDSILYGDEYEWGQGKATRSTLSRVDVLDFQDRLLIVLISGLQNFFFRGYSETFFLFDPLFYGDLLRHPAALSGVTDAADIIRKKASGETVKQPTYKRKYGEPAGRYTALGIAPYSRPLKMIRTTSRMLTDAPYYERIYKDAEQMTVAFLKNEMKEIEKGNYMLTLEEALANVPKDEQEKAQRSITQLADKYKGSRDAQIKALLDSKESIMKNNISAIMGERIELKYTLENIIYRRFIGFSSAYDQHFNQVLRPKIEKSLRKEVSVKDVKNNDLFEKYLK